MTLPFRRETLRAEDLPPTPEAWLAQLAEPHWFVLPGADRSRCRVVTTLLHGNEPSGLRGVHAFAASGRRPAVDVHVFLGAVPAARHAGGVRTLPQQRDLNRCFRAPWEGSEGALARAVLAEIAALEPEVVLDLHNTTGATPAFAVVTTPHPRADAVAGLFARPIVQTDLRIGALIEAAAAMAPALVVECGLAGNARADAIARDGLAQLFEAADLDALPPPAGLARLRGALRVRLGPETRVVFGAGPSATPVLRLRADFDAQNFVPQEAGAELGRVSPPGYWPLRVEDPAGVDHAHAWFEVEGDVLRLRRAAVLLMATVDTEAAADSLCYLAAPDPEAGAEPR